MIFSWLSYTHPYDILLHIPHKRSVIFSWLCYMVNGFFLVLACLPIDPLCGSLTYGIFSKALLAMGMHPFTISITCWSFVMFFAFLGFGQRTLRISIVFFLLAFSCLWIHTPHTLNSAYNEVAFNEKLPITKENLSTKYTPFTYKYIALNENLPITRRNLCIFFFRYRWSWV